MWMEVVSLLVPSLIGGVVASLLTNYWASRFAFGRFRKEQWWHEKRKASDSIIKELSRMKFHAAAYLESQEMGGATSLGKIDEQKDKSWSLREVAYAGAYIVSSKTVEAVERALRAQASYFEDPYSQSEHEYEVAKDVVDVVRREAHCDLGISQGPTGSVAGGGGGD